MQTVSMAWRGGVKGVRAALHRQQLTNLAQAVRCLCYVLAEPRDAGRMGATASLLTPPVYVCQRQLRVS